MTTYEITFTTSEGKHTIICNNTNNKMVAVEMAKAYSKIAYNEEADIVRIRAY